MIKCNHCYTSNQNDAVFCSYCGNRVNPYATQRNTKRDTGDFVEDVLTIAAGVVIGDVVGDFLGGLFD